ncbi:MAG TPA: DUF3368 domain-containing protein [Prolixibacteraceae bacterium]|nr:DUF3368 domain-containing protein [Prolixibacteraceae bacterium]
MKNGIIIADAGPIISLALVNKLDILELLFDEIKIPNAVWEEITINNDKPFYQTIFKFFKKKTQKIKQYNNLSFLMDYGESEALILYKEINANFLLIDDKKARNIAESLDIKCIGTIGLLSTAKNKQLIAELRPIFIQFIENKRFYSIELLNTILKNNNEDRI